MATLAERRIEPTDIPQDEMLKLRALFSAGEQPRLIGPEGETIEIPPALSDLFVYILGVMATHQAIVIVPEEEAFTTQAAANFLGMSRPYLLRLLEADKVPFHCVGSHRRILFKDLLAFQKARSAQRSATLSKMTKDLVAAGLYDCAPDPSELH